MKSNVQILDCTIRDGSYVIDYQFTVEDTYLVAAGLASAGVRHIEVGHGLGLNAQNCGKGSAAITDAEYIRAARAAAPEGLIGSFFIPGIGTEDSMRAAAEAGLGFVRVGIDVDDAAKLEPFVRLAKSLGLEVWGNLMKSYLLTPAQFADVCRRVGEFGTDVVALVDSAGGMTPTDIAAYTEAAVNCTRVPLAFHGHNNLSLAVANCLKFVECGGVYVDGTLSGMGRSGGNAATELLAVLLGERLAQPLDWKRLTEFADAMMQFCVPDHARPRAVEIATGVNYFHSSFRERVVAPAANHAGASLFRTILQLPKDSRKLVTPAIAAQAATAAAAEPVEGIQVGQLAGDRNPLERLQPGSLEKLAEQLRIQTGKSGQARIVTMARAPGGAMRIGPLRRGASSLVAHIEVAEADEIGDVRRALAGVCDFWILDQRLGLPAGAGQDSPQFVYDDTAVVARAIADTLQMLAGGAPRVALCGAQPAEISQIQAVGAVAESGPVDVLVACDPQDAAGAAQIARVVDGGVVLLVRAGALRPDAFGPARERGLRILRLDCGASLVAEAERLVATYQRCHRAAGEINLSPELRVVAAGVVGDAGDVVIDSRVHPRFILGIADGCGGIKPLTAADAERARRVQQWMVQQWGL